jgi:hypothetical protein
VSKRSNQEIIGLAKEAGFVHFWTGPFVSPIGIAIWEDDNVREYLDWGRSAYQAETLYVSEVEVEDVNAHRK